MEDTKPIYLSLKQKHINCLPLLKACGYDISDINKVKEKIREQLKHRQDVINTYIAHRAKGDVKNLDFKRSCRPFLFNVKEPRYSCNMSSFCPWCFVRRQVLPAVNELQKTVIEYDLFDSYVLSGCFYINRFYGRNKPEEKLNKKTRKKPDPDEKIDPGKLFLDEAFNRRSNLHSKLNSYLSKIYCVPAYFKAMVTENDTTKEQAFIGSFNGGFFLHPKDKKLDDLVKYNPKFKHIQGVSRAADLSQESMFHCFADTLRNINWDILYDPSYCQYLSHMLNFRTKKYKYVRTYEGKLNETNAIRQASVEDDSSRQTSL